MVENYKLAIKIIPVRQFLLNMFSIKESLLKAKNFLKKMTFNQINLIHTGKNISYPYSAITFSISNDVCISIVINHNTQYID